jgi:hypothetical protein
VEVGSLTIPSDILAFTMPLFLPARSVPDACLIRHLPVSDETTFPGSPVSRFGKTAYKELVRHYLPSREKGGTASWKAVDGEYPVVYEPEYIEDFSEPRITQMAVDRLSQ